ncbi:hypothetical protein FVQ89_01150 [Homoserinibacter sp. GY 40078]|nr:hypothetical protein FVQ89_01150 [Homoserinibacter sp. GY 40078]
MVFTWAIALAFLAQGFVEVGIGLSVSAVLLSILAVMAGIAAVVGRWGRGWGIAAIVVGVILNPVVVLGGLSWLGAM